MMFDEGANDTGGPFRAQSQLAAAAGFEDVHLFFDDVGGLAERPVEQVDGFKSRSAYFMKTKSLEQGARLAFQFLKLSALRRKNVVRPSDGLVFHNRELYDTNLPASSPAA